MVIVLVHAISARQDNNQERDIPQKLFLNKLHYLNAKRWTRNRSLVFFVRFSPPAFSHACAVRPSRPPYKPLSSHCSPLLPHMQARPMTQTPRPTQLPKHQAKCRQPSHLRLRLRRPSLPKNLPLSLHLQPAPNTSPPVPSPKSPLGMATNTTTILTSTGI